MKVYDICHITVEEIGEMFRINADNGWSIHLSQHEEDVYKKAVALPKNYDFSTIQIVSEAEITKVKQNIL